MRIFGEVRHRAKDRPAWIDCGVDAQKEEEMDALRGGNA